MIKRAKKDTTKNYKLTRQKLSMNQHEFWSRIGVTQSGGSRYENGRSVPEPTATLVVLTYGTQEKALEVLAKLRGVSVADLAGGAK